MSLDHAYKEENMGFNGRPAEPELKEVSLILAPAIGPKDK